MSGENCLDSFENRTKTQYPTDFGVGPIEYIYIYIYIYLSVCVLYVCVWYMDKL
jgi:hypothetical protein